MSDHDVGRFFDALTDDYTEAIERCFPRYREMLWALLDYLPQGRRFESVLELGCGTGNLSVLLHEAYPEAELHLVDVSGESLGACRDRLGDKGRFVWKAEDFRQLTYDHGTFDLIVSSIAIHHLRSPEKRQLFHQCCSWLTEDGIFSFADQCAGASQDVSERHVHHWKELSFNAGSSMDEWEMWMQHQTEHDHHDTLADQLNWIGEAGFSKVDCTWRYLLWSVVQARK